MKKTNSRIRTDTLKGNKGNLGDFRILKFGKKIATHTQTEIFQKKSNFHLTNVIYLEILIWLHRELKHHAPHQP